jgi:hypothetical protein
VLGIPIVLGVRRTVAMLAKLRSWVNMFRDKRRRAW